jgi:Protein of unknown function (DUF2752)
LNPSRAGGLHNLKGWVLAGALGIAAFAILHLWVPSSDIRTSVCLLRRLTGIPCPGCGLTRAFAHLAKGEWLAALRDHPLAPLIAAELGAAWIAWGAALRGSRRPGQVLARLDAIAMGNAALLVTVWLGRLATGTLPG